METNRSHFFEQETIQEVLDTINIVDLISNYVSLKKAGVNHKGLCPFHSEKTPSFVVSEPKQMFHCFGCGAGGNAIKFYMDMERKSFPESIIELAEKYGVRIEKFELTPEEEQRKKQYARYLSINKAAADFFSANLWNTAEGQKALQYLYKRKIEETTIKKFNVGYAMDEWQSLKEHLKARKVSEKEMADLGLISKNQDGTRSFDKFRGRLMFPISDQNGHVIAFGGRIIAEGEPKYLNSPDTKVYNKGRHLYGLHQAKQEIRMKDQSILVEGYMDVLVCHQFGIANAVASLGTALTENQAKLLMRFSINNTIAYDGDYAGKTAAIKAMDTMMSAGLKTRAILFPSGYDPDDFLLQAGKEKFDELLQTAENPVIFKLNYLIDDECTDISEKNRIVEELAPDIFRIKSTIIRDDLLKKISSRLGLKEEVVRSELRLLYRRKDDQKTISAEKKPDHSHKKINKINKDQAFILQKICENQALLSEVEKRGGLELFDQDLQTLYLSFANKNNHDIIENRKEIDEQLLSCVMLQECTFDNQDKAFSEILNKMYSEKLEKDFQSKQNQLAMAEKNNDTETMMIILKDIETIIKNKDRIRKGLFH